MIALDTYLDAIFKDLGVKRYPVKIQDNGGLYVPETITDISCINETFFSVEYSSTGAMRVKSQFYFFSPLKKDEDVLEDVNVKMLAIIVKLGKFRKALKTLPFNTEFQTGELQTFRNLTAAWETGIQTFVTFDIEQPC